MEPPLQSRFTNGQQKVILKNECTVVKRGFPVRIAKEIASIEFVQKHTSIPVPKIHKTWSEGSHEDAYGYIEMERSPGVQLEFAWPNMSVNARSTTTAELTGYMKQLRAIVQREPGWIGGSDRGGMFDCRLSMKASEEVGPFTSETEFTKYISRGLVERGIPKYQDPILPVLATYKHKIMFTHGDLSSMHVFVDPKSGQIQGIIDWEMAGWMPEYWEYRKALYGWKHDEWWVSFVKRCLDNYDLEAGIDYDLEPW